MRRSQPEWKRLLWDAIVEAVDNCVDQRVFDLEVREAWAEKMRRETDEAMDALEQQP